MVICPACGHVMVDSPSQCEACGEHLDQADAEQHTIVVKRDDFSITRQKGWQSAELGKDHAIHALIDQAIVTITLRPEQVITLGRVEADSQQTPDVDFAPFGAWDKGVSRLHAELGLIGDMVQIKDLNSTNGTFLNGRPVSAGNWQIVRNNDELRLGRLVIILRFPGE